MTEQKITEYNLATYGFNQVFIDCFFGKRDIIRVLPIEELHVGNRGIAYETVLLLDQICDKKLGAYYHGSLTELDTGHYTSRICPSSDAFVCVCPYRIYELIIASVNTARKQQEEIDIQIRRDMSQRINEEWNKN